MAFNTNIDKYPERLSRDEYQDEPFHMTRYKFVVPFVSGKTILDIACGEGFGSRFLSTSGAKTVIGMDLQLSAVDREKMQNGFFANASATNIPLEQESVDVVVSMETIEHIPNYEDALQEYKRVLRDDGVLLLSTPNALITKPINGIPRNPYHVKEFEPDELAEVLHRHFTSVDLYGQRVRGTVPSSSKDSRKRRKSFRDIIHSLILLLPLSWRLNFPKLLPKPLADEFVLKITGHHLYIKNEDMEFAKAGIFESPVIFAICKKI